jgi:hypothetical protein
MEGTVRIWLGIGGNFTDDASTDLLVGKPAGIKVSQTVLGDHYEFKPAAGGVAVHVTKSPLTFKLVSSAGKTLMTESTGLSWNKTTTCVRRVRAIVVRFQLHGVYVCECQPHVHMCGG